jgi:hypothetical protein
MCKFHQNASESKVMLQYGEKAGTCGKWVHLAFSGRPFSSHANGRMIINEEWCGRKCSSRILENWPSICRSRVEGNQRKARRIFPEPEYPTCRLHLWTLQRLCKFRHWLIHYSVIPLDLAPVWYCIETSHVTLQNPVLLHVIICRYTTANRTFVHKVPRLGPYENIRGFPPRSAA